MHRPITVLVGCFAVLGLLTLPALASPARETGPAAAVTGTWRSYTCGDCFGTLAVAPDGVVWGGTASGGVTRWDPASGTFQRFTDREGLPGNWVSKLAVDSRGRPWAALRGSHYPTDWGWLGLGTYDGTRWITYNTTNGLPSDAINSLATDTTGKVWAATNAGLAQFDGTTWTVIDQAAGLPSNVVYQVAVGPDGTLWASTDNGLGRYRQGAWTTFNQPGVPQMLFADPWGQVWLDTGGAGGLSRFDGTTWTKVDLGGSVTSMAVGAGPLVWAMVDSTPPTLQSFDGARWTVGSAPTFWSSNAGLRVAASPTRPDVYVGGVLYDGLQRFDGSHWSTARLEDGPDALITEAVAVDSADRLHVGLFNAGSRYGFTRVEAGTWQTRWSDEVSEPVVFNRPIAIDGRDTVWLGGWRAGVARHAAGAWQLFSTSNGLPGSPVRALATDAAGRLWVGTEDGGAALYDGTTWRTYSTTDGLASQDVRSALVDRAGRVWLGTSGAGLSRFEGGQWRTFTVADGLGGLDVFDLAEGRNGVLWAGGHGWVARFDGAAWHSFATPIASTDSASFVTVAVALDGAVWHAESESTGGVSRYDGSSWQTFSSKDGLLSDAVYDLAVDSRGTLWAATLLGVASFTPDAPAVPTPAPPAGPCICQLARRLVPSAVLDDAVANPARYAGWQQPLDPGKPVGPYNPPRTCLTLQNPNVAYHPAFNGPVWRVGCP